MNDRTLEDLEFKCLELAQEIIRSCGGRQDYLFVLGVLHSMRGAQIMNDMSALFEAASAYSAGFIEKMDTLNGRQS
jgi:hypothetical protein